MKPRYHHVDFSTNLKALFVGKNIYINAYGIFTKPKTVSQNVHK